MRSTLQYHTQEVVSTTKRQASKLLLTVLFLFGSTVVASRSATGPGRCCRRWSFAPRASNRWFLLLQRMLLLPLVQALHVG